MKSSSKPRISKVKPPKADKKVKQQVAADKIRKKLGLKKDKPAKAEKTTAIAVRKPADEFEITPSFIEEAKAADKDIRETYRQVEQGHVALGRKAESFFQKKYHRAFKMSFDEWLDSVADGRGKKHTQILQSMRIVRELTKEGVGQLADDDIQKMTRQNAEALVRIPPKQRTPKVVQAAQTLTEKQFQTEVAMPILQKEGKLKTEPRGQVIPADSGIVVKRLGPYHFSEPVVDSFLEAVDIMAWKARDDQRDVSLLEKAFDAMAAEIKSAYQAEYEDFRRDEAKRDEATARKNGKDAEPEAMEG